MDAHHPSSSDRGHGLPRWSGLSPCIIALVEVTSHTDERLVLAGLAEHMIVEGPPAVIAIAGEDGHCFVLRSQSAGMATHDPQKLDSSELIAVVTPGSILVFGAIPLFPTVWAPFGLDRISVGGPGLFVIVSFVAGQLVQVLGNVDETLIWRPFAGMPRCWVRQPDDLFSTRASSRVYVRCARAISASSWSGSTRGAGAHTRSAHLGLVLGRRRDGRVGLLRHGPFRRAVRPRVPCGIHLDGTGRRCASSGSV